MSYYDLWAILGSWRREFSSAEFAWTFASPDPRKVLHDMVEKGLLEHVERGKYRVRSSGEYAMVENSVSSGYELLARAKLPYALTGVDGVFVWTRGGYNAGRFFGFYPIHLKVLARDLPRWHRFFGRAGKNAFVAERKPEKTMFGLFYVLHPETRFRSETVSELRVEPLTDTLRFCRNNMYTFEPALKMLTANDEALRKRGE